MTLSLWFHTHTHPTFNGLWSGTTRVGRHQKKHSPTHAHPDHRNPLSSSSIYNDQWHLLCSFYVLDSLLVQPLSRSSLVFLLVLDPQLHTTYISSPRRYGFTKEIFHIQTIIDSVTSDLFNKVKASNHCLYYLLPRQRPLHDALRVRGHQFQLPNCIYKFHKQSFIVSSLFRF